MLKTNFAEKAFQITEASVAFPFAARIQDNKPVAVPEPFDGNAFGGSAANRSQAELSLLQNAIVNGGESGAPLVNVVGRLSGSFNGASGRKKDGQDRNNDMMMSIILDQQAKRFGEYIQAQLADAKEALAETQDVKKRFEEGTFDPLNYDQDKEYIEERGLSEEQWKDMAIQSQERWIEQELAADIQEVQEIEKMAEDFARDPSAAKAKLAGLEGVDGELTQAQMSETYNKLRAQQAEARNSLPHESPIISVSNSGPVF